jgi:hypothetical protein
VHINNQIANYVKNNQIDNSAYKLLPVSTVHVNNQVANVDINKWFVTEWCKIILDGKP